MTERQLLTLFGKKIKELKPTETIVYEAKMVKGRFRLASVAQHQTDGLLAALHGLWYKISDSPIYTGNKSRFTFPKPFDAIWIKADQAYVVPVFYTPRVRKIAYLIPIREFMKFDKTSIKEDELKRFESIEL